jgi:nucleoid-associated protein YgaU
MASNRYSDDDMIQNKAGIYKKYLSETRGLKHINQYRTQTLRYPSPSEVRTLDFEKHIWKVGDRFSKLAYKYYGDVEMWWVIAMFNKSPTEAHVKTGNLIYIPLPLDKTLNYMLKG